MVGALIAVVGSIPPIAGRVRMNPWYGIRVPEAFISEKRWTEINRYGGWLLLIWGVAIALTATAGAFLDRRDWLKYNWAALMVMLGGPVLIVTLIYRHARRTNNV